ncbi:hybrid sensor histidine kinase/response regulator [Candidatus Saccharibacteria bacterium]|nr:hybrid sensor histidine kinase/response regulator [Candidatus Saccharibacteria bacterium]
MNPTEHVNIRVLVVEDDEDDWLITKKIFTQIPGSPFKIELAKTYEQAIELIDQNIHDVYLIDYRLGEHTGTDILEHAHPERRSQPFILMTGVSDSDLEWRSLRLAAADYLVKGSFDAMLLSRTLNYSIQRKHIEQQRIDQLINLNRAKEDFISIASHQLRTPATGVKQYLGMVVEGFVGDVPPAQMELLKQAYRSNERQLRIISDLLKVAQVDSGKMKLQPTPVTIDELINEVIDEQMSTLTDRSQTIKRVEYDTLLPLIRVDSDAIRMVLENLIDNASKYSPEETQIQVEVSEQPETLTISVLDCGVGIQDHDLPRLYEKFTRFENILSTKVGGSGLGLYWAKRIVDMHGGRIDYRPNQPTGSVFSIILPKKGLEK